MRQFMVLGVFLSLHFAVRADEDLEIAKNGKSDYVICLAASATPVEQTAAKELQDHLEKVTGAKLEIRAENEVPTEAKQIVVGQSSRMRSLAPQVDVEKLGHDGIVVKTVGRNVILVGRPLRGTLYAVYTFLEDGVGCRWWSSTESSLPRKPTLAIPKLDIAYAPKLQSREAFYRDAFNSVFAARLKLNGHHHRIPPEYGSHYWFSGFVHTFFPLLPPGKYFAEHPEWYSEINGKRIAERSQLCLTNEEMRQELVRNALARLRKDPQAKFISISQNDWHGQCQCERCRAIEQEEGSSSGPLIRFVNAVAEDIEKEFPDVMVETLAYQYTRKPPLKAKPRHNVVIRLCSIECSFVQPLASGEQNEKFRADIEGWSSIAPHLFVWNYVTNFSNYILPHPNMRVLAPNLRFFVDNNVIGLFEQGDSTCSIGDFVRLRAWVLAHLMWKPDLDENVLKKEFMDGYYGAAAPHLMAYLDSMHNAAERSGVYLRCFMNDTAGWLTLDDLNQAMRLFEKAAQAVADDPVLAERVRRERLPLDHVWLKRYHALKLSARLTGSEFLGPKDPAAACDEFIRLANQFDARTYRERHQFKEYEENLRRRFRPAGPPPAQCEGLDEDEWIDFQDNQFGLSYRKDWVKTADDANASDGKAARMPGDHYEWAVQYRLTDDVKQGNPWHCYVAARCEATAASGTAMTMGIYDTRAKKGVSHRKISVEQSAGATYRVFDLGSHDLDGGMYIWVAPPKRPGDVTAVYVDRIFLMRDE